MVMIHCRDCGEKISSTASSCPKCGAKQSNSSNNNVKKVNHIVVVLFSIFLGWLGIDRFYMGHIGLGLGKLFTLGGLGVWWLIDIILIASKKVNNVEWE